MLKPIILISLACAICNSTASFAQDGQSSRPDEQPLVVNAEGEEIFGPGYLPSDPVSPGAPLQVGKPSAGFQIKMNQNVDGREFLSGANPASQTVPLRRTVRKMRNLPKFKFKTPSALRTSNIGLADDSEPVSAVLSEMTLHTVYVAQGAGAILEFPCGVAVIDTGGEFGPGAAKGGKLFVDYLNAFFDSRPHLNRTIDVLFTSHPHMDHLAGLSSIFPQGGAAFTVRNIVDNGQSGSSGSLLRQTKARNTAIASGAGYSAVRLQDQFSATGATNKVIDPFICPTVDPIITAFWGSRNEAVSGAATSMVHKYNNPNNHSVVLRVDFGKASFLFTGDLQDEAISDMLKEYDDNPGVFDVGVYHVGHHGADNGTTDSLLRATSPKIALISMGDKSSQKPSTAFDHGHPRTTTLRRMQVRPGIVSDSRVPVVFWGAKAEETPFLPVRITKAIYGTGWEGTIKLRARSDGSYQILP
jgi:beta-lactamase superfamily II metal-dependent hydrolase